MTADWSFVAEDADAYQAMPSSAVREIRSDVVLIHRSTGGAWSNLATRVRFSASAVDASIADTRHWFGSHHGREYRWLIGPSATPSRIVDMLLERGAVRDGAEPVLTAMILDREPPSVTGIVVREVATFADFEQMEAIREAVFGGQEHGPDARAAAHRARWAEFGETNGAAAFLAEQDGNPVAFGVMYPTKPGPLLLAGGVTLPEARGRGAYRALVHARWHAARRAGTQALVTQAQAASRPILERLGFRATGAIEVLVDAST